MTVGSTSSRIMYPLLEFRTQTDIDEAMRDDQVAVYVTGTTRNYHVINVSDTMTSLLQVGDLLQLAYAGTIGFDSSVPVARILSRYQTLAVDSEITTGNFLENILQALRLHNLALRTVERGGAQTALQFLSKCSTLAGEMAERSSTLVVKATALREESENALLAVIQNNTVSIERQEQIKQSLTKLKAREAHLKAKAAQLESHVEQAREKEAEAAKEVDKIHNRAFAMQLLSTVMRPLEVCLSPLGTAVDLAATKMGIKQMSGCPSLLGNSEPQRAFEAKERGRHELEEVERRLAEKRALLKEASGVERQQQLQKEIDDLEKEMDQKRGIFQELERAFRAVQGRLEAQAESAEQREEMHARERRELQREQRETNADLAESIERLKSENAQHNDLNVAIESLQVSIKTLGKIKTIFENVRAFWLGVQRHCESLTDRTTLELLAAPEFQDLFTEEIKRSGLNWLALGRINWVAKQSLESARGRVDRIMSNLPSREEAPHLVHSISGAMLLQLESENKVLQEQDPL